MVQISSRFVADLERLAHLKRKIDELDELGKRLNPLDLRETEIIPFKMAHFVIKKQGVKTAF